MPAQIRNRNHRLVTITGVIFLILCTKSSLVLSQTTAGPRDQIDFTAIQNDMSKTTVALEKTRTDIDRSRFEPTALVEKLEFEAAPAIEFVRDAIVYQPYAGTLRGAAGTLRSGAGNSLDQSILLANLLKTGGFDARIVLGTLTDADALRLLHSISKANTGASLDYLQDSLSINFGVQPNQTLHAVSLADTQLAKETRSLVDTLKLSLQNAGVNLFASDVQALWLGIAKQYFWVQHRDGPSQAWQDTHPAFGVSAAPQDLEAQTFFADAVPEQYQHKLTISAWVGQWLAGKINTRQIMTPWTRPVANLDVHTISYRNSPGGLNMVNAGNLDTVFKDTQTLIPMFNGAIAPGAMAFDLQGRVIDLMALGAGAGVFQTMGNKMGEAAGGLMDRNDKQPAMALNSMWLEFTFTAPGGAQTTHRRYILPPQSDHNSEATELLWPLLTNHSYLVNVGGQPLDYLADRYIATGIKNQDWLTATIGKFREPEKTMTAPASDIPSDFPVLAQYRFMDDNPFSETGVVSFRAKPSLVGLRRGFRDADTAFAGVDIIANHIEHLRVTDDGLVQVPSAGLTRGVWDTVLESIPQKALSVAASSSSSTATVFKQAGLQNISIKVLKPGADDALTGLGLDTIASQFVQADLNHGYTVVLPERQPEGVATTGWWRVDAATGETLGMTGDGHGQDLVEYATEVVGIAFNMVQALQSLKDCDKQANDVAKMCCLVEANINNVAGLGFGSLLGATVGTAGAAVFDILNYATSAATGGQGLMPTAKLGCEKMQATAW